MARFILDVDTADLRRVKEVLDRDCFLNRCISSIRCIDSSNSNQFHVFAPRNVLSDAQISQDREDCAAGPHEAEQSIEGRLKILFAQASTQRDQIEELQAEENPVAAFQEQLTALITKVDSQRDEITLLQDRKDEAEEPLKDRVEEIVDDMEFNDIIDDRINDFDFDDIIDDRIDEYDMEAKIRDATGDHIADVVKEMFRDEYLDDAVRAAMVRNLQRRD